MSCQLLVNAEGKDCLEAKEKVHVIGNRLKILLKEVTHHIKDLEKILDISGSQLVSSCCLFPSILTVFSDECCGCAVSIVCNTYQDATHVILNIIK